MACGVAQRVSTRYIIMIRLYFILAAAAAVGTTILCALRFGILPALLPAVLSAALLLAVIVLPDIYIDRLTYTRHRDWLMVERGILWHQTILIPRRQIQYIRLRRTPVERLLGLSTLVFMTSGGRVYMRGLEPEESQRLRHLLLNEC